MPRTPKTIDHARAYIRAHKLRRLTGQSPYYCIADAAAANGAKQPQHLSLKAWGKQIATTWALPHHTTTKPAPTNRKPSVNTDAFLASYEWRALRMRALKLYGTQCQCCGASPTTGAVLNVDHIKPRKLFPELALNIDNLQILCHECNHGKGNWDTTDWRPKAAAVATQPLPTDAEAIIDRIKRQTWERR